MKHIIFCLTLAAFASAASLQADDSKATKASAPTCDKATASKDSCSKCCNVAKANPIQKGASLLIAKR